MSTSLPKDIAPPDYLSIVWEHLTEATCNAVFQLTRDRERQRKWTLFALLQFWTGLLQTPGASQTGAILGWEPPGGLVCGEAEGSKEEASVLCRQKDVDDIQQNPRREKIHDELT